MSAEVSARPSSGECVNEIETTLWLGLDLLFRVVRGQPLKPRDFFRHCSGSRCSIESCFREGKEELGLDHYEVRGWRCVHRHFYITQLSHLFCARVRQQYDAAGDQVDRVSVEQVRSAMNVWLDAADFQAPMVRTGQLQSCWAVLEFTERMLHGPVTGGHATSRSMRPIIF